MKGAFRGREVDGLAFGVRKARPGTLRQGVDYSQSRLSQDSEIQSWAHPSSVPPHNHGDLSCLFQGRRVQEGSKYRAHMGGGPHHRSDLTSFLFGSCNRCKAVGSEAPTHREHETYAHNAEQAERNSGACSGNSHHHCRGS